jgi:hypothetical protein
MLHDLLGQKKQYQIVYKKLVDFRVALINDLDRIAKTGHYVFDFHGDNIMYHLDDKKMYLVDASLETGWTAFYNKVMDLKTWNKDHHEISEIWTLIQEYKKGLPEDFASRKKFFERYVDIYLGRYVREMAPEIGPKIPASSTGGAAMPFIIVPNKKAG